MVSVRRMLRLFFHLAWLYGAVASVWAEPTEAAILPIVYPPGITSPAIDPTVELQGAALLDALRAGGLILFMRHAQTGDPTPECPNESGLTPIGGLQSRIVGSALRRLKLPIQPLQASETCRARDTAVQLGLGAVEVNPELNPGSIKGRPYDYAQKFKFLMTLPPTGKNSLLVSHVHEAPVKEDRILIELAEVVVYRPRPGQRALAIARIPVAAWSTLLSPDAVVR